MSKRYLVSIISDHTLPNFLVAKQLSKQYDQHILLVSSAMQRNAELFLKALSDDKSCQIIKTGENENDIQKIKQSLQDANLCDKDQYIVNLTGGTKILSLGVYEYFSKLNQWFIYVPFGKNEIVDLNNDTIPITHEATLEEYLKLYGMTYQCTDEADFIKPEEETLNFFNELKITKLKTNLHPLVQAAKFHESTNNSSEILMPEERRYYSGQWFEEYMYYHIKNRYNLDDDKIALSVKLFRNEEDVMNDNELDIAFVKDNKLHVIECKSGLREPMRNTKDILDDVLYKCAAISKDLGLKVNSYLAVLENIYGNSNTQALESLEKRKSILGIRKIWDKNSFMRDKIEL